MTLSIPNRAFTHHILGAILVLAAAALTSLDGARAEGGAERPCFIHPQIIASPLQHERALAHPSARKAVVALLTQAGWSSWCHNCDALVNVTRAAASEVHQTVCPAQAGQGKEGRRRGRGDAGALSGGSSDAGVLTLVIDCGAFMPGLPDSPCHGVTAFPQLQMWVTGRQTTPSIFRNVQKTRVSPGAIKFWIESNLPRSWVNSNVNVVPSSKFLAGQQEVALDSDNSAKIVTVASAVNRSTTKQILLLHAQHPETLVLTLINAAECRTCGPWLLALEVLARVAFPDEVAAGRLAVLRVPVDEEVQGRWLGPDVDIPQLGIWLPHELNNGHAQSVPLLFTADGGDAAQLARFVAFTLDKLEQLRRAIATAPAAFRARSSSSNTAADRGNSNSHLLALQLASLAKTPGFMSVINVIDAKEPKTLRVATQIPEHSDDAVPPLMPRVSLVLVVAQWTVLLRGVQRELNSFVAVGKTFASARNTNVNATFSILNADDLEAMLAAKNTIFGGRPPSQLCTSLPCLLTCSSSGAHERCTGAPTAPGSTGARAAAAVVRELDFASVDFAIDAPNLRRLLREQVPDAEVEFEGDGVTQTLEHSTAVAPLTTLFPFFTLELPQVEDRFANSDKREMRQLRRESELEISKGRKRISGLRRTGQHMLVLFHNFDTRVAAAADASRRALTVFEDICAEFNSSSIGESPLLCGTMDATRYPRLAAEFSARVIESEREHASRGGNTNDTVSVLMPFVVHIAKASAIAARQGVRSDDPSRVTVTFESDDGNEIDIPEPDGVGKVVLELLSTVPRSQTFITPLMLRNSIAGALGRAAAVPKPLRKLSINTFEKTVKDPEFGVLVLFTGGSGCAHSNSVIPTFEAVADFFARDRREVLIATVDAATQLDSELRSQYGITRTPMIKWFPKHTATQEGAATGEIFESTPFKDSLVEFVHDEMGYPYVELDWDKNTTLESVTSRNFDDLFIRDRNESHTVLFLYESRVKDEDRIKLLKRVEEHFQDTTIFGFGKLQPGDSEKMLVKYATLEKLELEKRRAVQKVLDEAESELPVPGEDSDDSYVPRERDEKSEWALRRKLREAQLTAESDDERNALGLGDKGSQLTRFFKMDGRRFRKLLHKHQLHDLTRNNKLPLLLFLPRGDYKLTKYKIFGKDRVSAAVASQPNESATIADSKDADDDDEFYIDDEKPDEAGTLETTASSIHPGNATFTPFTEIEISRFVMAHVDTSKFAAYSTEQIRALLNFTEDDVQRDAAARQRSYVHELTQNTFREFVLPKGDAVVLFYAKWCQHSQAYMPVFEQIARSFADDDTIRFARIDVPENHETGHAQGIQQFPTVKVYFHGSVYRDGDQIVGEEITGNQSPEELLGLLQHRGTSKVAEFDRMRKQREESVLELNESNWKSLVVNRTDHILVEFYAPWCGHCHSVIPALQELGKIYDITELPPQQRGGLERMRVGKIDGTEFVEIAKANNITGSFPVIYLYSVRKDSKGRVVERRVSEYKNHRFVDLFVEFVEKEVPALRAARAALIRFRREKEKTGNKADTATGGGGASKQQAQQPKTKQYKKKREIPRRDAEKPRRETGKKSDGSAPPRRGRSYMVEEEKYGKKLDPIIRTVNHETIEPLLGSIRMVLLLSYTHSDDFKPLASMFNDVALMVKPLVERGWLTLAVADITSDSVLRHVTGPNATVTIFRGFAVPSTVQFRAVDPNSIRSSHLDDTLGLSDDEFDDLSREQQLLLRRSITSDLALQQAGGEGVGGLVTNVSHVMSFLERNFILDPVSRELRAPEFDDVTQNASMTVAVMFYAPWSEACRNAADAFDAQAQAFAHRSDVEIYRVDISLAPVLYRAYGEKKLPALFVFDRVEDPGEDAPQEGEEGRKGNGLGPKRRKKVARYYGSEEAMTVDSIRHFIAAGAKAKVETVAERDARVVREAEPAVRELTRMLVELGAIDPVKDHADADEAQKREAANSLPADREQAALEDAQAAKEQLAEAGDPLFVEEVRRDATQLQYVPLQVSNMSQLQRLVDAYPRMGVFVMARTRWCAHCERYLPTLRRVTSAMRKKLAVVELRLERGEEAVWAAKLNGSKAFPSFALLANRTATAYRGGKSLEELVAFLDSYLRARVVALRGAPADGAAFAEAMDENLPAYRLYVPGSTTAGDAPFAADSNGGGGGSGSGSGSQESMATGAPEESGASAPLRLDAQEEDIRAALREARSGVVVFTTSPTCGGKCSRIQQHAAIAAASLRGRNVVVFVLDLASRATRSFARSEFGLASAPGVAVRCVAHPPSLAARVKSAGTLATSAQRLAEEAAVLVEEQCWEHDLLAQHRLEEKLKKLHVVEGPVYQWLAEDVRRKAMNEFSIFVLFLRRERCPRCAEALEVWREMSGLLKMNPSLKFAVVDVEDVEENSELLREAVGETTYGLPLPVPQAALFPMDDSTVAYRGAFTRAELQKFLEQEENKALASHIRG